MLGRRNPSFIENLTYQSLGIGGIYFDIVAKNDIVINGISVMTREAGNSTICVYGKEGSHQGSAQVRGDWEVLVPENSVLFATEICSKILQDAEIFLVEGERYSFYCDNNTMSSGNEIIMHNASSSHGNYPTPITLNVCEENDDVSFFVLIIRSRFINVYLLREIKVVLLCIQVGTSAILQEELTMTRAEDRINNFLYYVYHSKTFLSI